MFGKHEQHVSVSVSGSGGIPLFLSAHPFLLRSLQWYSVAIRLRLFCYLCCFDKLACLLAGRGAGSS